ncbi:DinB family protein [Paracoccus aerodenitrificans]|uniref:DinB family protein n=1 Tax=Paracoccus aerodenitrificans TaxID=3017781 RepID=UPI0022F09D83|nr:DinB family protein [Paracoccus aerodenitrificans]WBU63072.1 damage-inducible protein DinB [Paracoccus aerodenitrificans]
MIDGNFVLLMARYNLWQNDGILRAADELSAAERKRDRGAFFGSIQRTLSHLYWADMMWFSRFAGTKKPEQPIAESGDLITDWDRFCDDRRDFDRRILNWAGDVSEDWLRGDLEWYSGSTLKRHSQPISLLVVHFFNHQTHHRGQIHAMLTTAGARHDLTDLAFMPAPYRDM